jgi:hypothetical protein
VNKQTKNAVLTAAILVLFSSAVAAKSGTSSSSSAARDSAASRVTVGGPSPLSKHHVDTINTVQAAVKSVARGHNEAVARSVAPNAQITSRDRPYTATAYSTAHNRGATDVVVPGRDLRSTAQSISRAAGPHTTVIAEQAYRDGVNGYRGRDFDRQTSYVNGVQGNERTVSPHARSARAGGDPSHIHIQPEYGVNKRGGYQPLQAVPYR